MKLFFYDPQPKSLELRAFLIKRKERKLQYQWYHNFRSYLVEMTGFEPAASSSRTKRATKLRYISLCTCARTVPHKGETPLVPVGENGEAILKGAQRNVGAVLVRAPRCATSRYVVVHSSLQSLLIIVCSRWFVNAFLEFSGEMGKFPLTTTPE